ncbi:IS6 family transposase [Chitinimonas sp. BJB300]|nr:IS6 family transposase [Chitinimonas sp. BJB300]
MSSLRNVLKRLHYPLEIMLMCVRGYAAYPLSLRHLEEMMAERGVTVDHATIHRWALKRLPVLAKVFRQRHQTANSADARIQGLSFDARIIAGIETLHMICKGQLDCPKGTPLSSAQQFYSLAY